MTGPITIPALNTEINTQLASAQTGGITALQLRGVLTDMNAQREYFITPQMKGAIGNGVADDTAAIQACVTEANGTTPVFISAIFGITSTINVPANTIFFGRGGKLSGFKVLGSSLIAPMLKALNGGNVQFYDIGFYGNNASWGGGGSGNVPGAFWMLCTLLSGPAFLYGPKFYNCYFENIAADIWVGVSINSGGSLTQAVPIRNPVVDGCRFKSFSGNGTGQHSIVIESCCIQLDGDQSNLLGQITGAQITNNYADCVGIKQFCICFTNVKGALVAYNTILDAGNLADNNVGSYGITFYNDYGTTYGGADSSYPNFLLARPTGKIIGNTITGTRDIAIYSPQSLDLQILNNRIDTTLNGSPVSLALGGISVNGGDNTLIDGNIISNWAAGGGAELAGIIVSSAGAGVTIGDNNILTNSVVANGILIYTLDNNVDTKGPVWIGSPQITLTGSSSVGITLISDSGFSLTQVYIESPIISATYAGIRCLDAGGVLGLAIALLKIAGPVLSGFTNTGIIANLIITGRLEIGEPRLDMTAGGNGINIDGSTDYNIDDWIATNIGGGTVFSAAGATGSPPAVITPKMFGSTASLTVGTLPSAATFPRSRAFVNNAGQTVTANIGAVLSGTGGNTILVYSDGTNWRVG